MSLMYPPSRDTYQCVRLSPDHKRWHDPEQVPLFETTDLAEACTFVYHHHRDTGEDVAVWQPRTQGYREIYQKTNRHTKRDRSGRFIKAQPKEDTMSTTENTTIYIEGYELMEDISGDGTRYKTVGMVRYETDAKKWKERESSWRQYRRRSETLVIHGSLSSFEGQVTKTKQAAVLKKLTTSEISLLGLQSTVDALKKEGYL